MGVLNVTPDSFSDGGKYLCPEKSVAFARQLKAQGASIIDVGGQSSRPGADPITAEEELARILPVIERLASELPEVRMSVDTYYPQVAAAACAAGAHIINDISGFRDPDMVEVARSAGADCVLMHMAGEPRTMQDDPFYVDVVQEVGDYLLAGAERLVKAGITADQIILDPGFGFGKTRDHNLELFLHMGALADRIHEAGHKLLVGISRKSFIGSLFGIEDPEQRDRASAELAAALTTSSTGGCVDILRVHNPEITCKTLQAFAEDTPAVEAYIALGSNLGGPMGNLATALHSLDKLSHTQVREIAAPVLSEPAYDSDQQAFTNTVCRITTQLDPLALFAYMQAIEVDMGREKTHKNGPRIIDLDLLSYGDCTLDLPALIVPHPRIEERAFVLEPLQEIAPDFRLPGGVRLKAKEYVHGKLISRLPFVAIESELTRRRERER